MSDEIEVFIDSEKHVNYQLEKRKNTFKRIFPHIFTEIAALIAVLSIIGFAAGIVNTATISQEVDLMQPIKPSYPHDVEDEPQETVPQPTLKPEDPEDLTQPVPPMQTIEYPTYKMCFIGDSRTVGMQNAVFTDVQFIVNSSAGVDWFNKTAAVQFEKNKDNIELCVVALGLNDLANAGEYIKSLNDFAEQYPEKVFIYANIGPVDENICTNIQNQSLEIFNEAMKEGLSERWQIVDQYTYLAAEGFGSGDGIHYDFQDSAKIFAWIVHTVKIQIIEIVN